VGLNASISTNHDIISGSTQSISTKLVAATIEGLQHTIAKLEKGNSQEKEKS
jgi:hypothetical protein